jgi:hypothetical protein
LIIQALFTGWRIQFEFVNFQVSELVAVIIYQILCVPAVCVLFHPIQTMLGYGADDFELLSVRYAVLQQLTCGALLVALVLWYVWRQADWLTKQRRTGKLNMDDIDIRLLCLVYVMIFWLEWDSWGVIENPGSSWSWSSGWGLSLGSQPPYPHIELRGLSAIRFLSGYSGLTLRFLTNIASRYQYSDQD